MRGKLQLKKNSSKAEALSESNLNTDTKSNKAEALSEFEDCCKLVRKAVRADKREWLNEKGNLIQELADMVSIPVRTCHQLRIGKLGAWWYRHWPICCRP